MKTITSLILVSIVMLFAEDVENPGEMKIMETKLFKVEGTAENTNIKINEYTKVSGEEYDLPDGPAYSESIPPVDITTLPNTDDPTSGTIYTFPKREINLRKNESGTSGPKIIWDDDVLVYDGEVGEGQDFDEDEVTEDIYAIFDTYHSTNDSLIVYRSTDGGNSFQWWRASVNGDGEIGNPKIRIARDAGGQTWVCMFGIWHEPSGDDILYMRRMTPDQSQSAWEQVNANVDYADADADIGVGAWIYVTYIPEGSVNDIWAARNYLAGAGWQDDQLLFINPGVFPYPQIAAGWGGNVAVTFVDDRLTTNNEIRIKRSINYGSTWLGSQQVSNNTGAYAISQTDIAYSYSSSYQTGWITSSFYVVDNYNLVYYWSPDAGVSWTYGGLIGSSGNDENSSSLRSQKASGALTVAYNQDPGDSTMFTWTTASDPTGFITPYRINDYSATGIWAPTAGWITSGGGYSAILYSSQTMGYNLFFDWFDNTAVEEIPDDESGVGVVNLAPNPSRGSSARLSFVVINQGNVNISVYDATGRIVKTLVNENKPAGDYLITMNNENLAAGVYFVKVKTPEGTAGKTMTIIR